jgi:Uri superfamily endonuclease
MFLCAFHYVREDCRKWVKKRWGGGQVDDQHLHIDYIRCKKSPSKSYVESDGTEANIAGAGKFAPRLYGSDSDLLFFTVYSQ